MLGGVFLQLHDSAPRRAEALRRWRAAIRRVWTHTRGHPDVRIALLDGMPDLAHPCFHGSRLRVVRDHARPNGAIATASSPSAEHATHIASLIFARHNAIESQEGTRGDVIRGIAPHCTGLIIPIFRDEPGGGVAPCAQPDLARAIRLALAHGAHVINLSAGQPGDASAAHPDLRDAVRECAARGVLLVCSAGNDGCDCAHVPAALPHALAVGALAHDGLPASFSNFARLYAGHGVCAPGADLQGALPGGRAASRSGTSFATPLVASLAALLFSHLRARGGGLSALAGARVRRAILESVRPCDLGPSQCRRLLRGEVDPARAFQHVHSGEPVMSDPVQRPLPSALGVQPSCEGRPGCACGKGAAPTNDDTPDETDDQSVIEGEEEQDEAGEVEAAGVPRARGNSLAPRAASVVTARQPRRPARAVEPSGCGCGGGGAPELVYALGQLGVDFGTPARADAFDADMEAGKFASVPRDVLDHINTKGNEHLASALIWTLNLDATPFYAIRPEGPYAREAYARLVEFLGEQLDSKAERVSIPGILDGTVQLTNGMSVPVVVPDLRGMFNWTTRELVAQVCGKRGESAAEKKEYEAKFTGLKDFLERIYHGVRNLGRAPDERALNFAATNAFNLEHVFEQTAKADLQLDEIAVERSVVCRPGSDCWDVKLIFFNPEDTLGSARTAHRFCVDVSDVVPVLVGEVRSWRVR